MTGGRPPVGPSTSVRLPLEVIERLDALAEEEGTTRSALLRRGALLLLQGCAPADGEASE